MPRDQTIGNKTRAHLERLENEYRTYFSVFESLQPVEKLDDALDRISLLELLRIFIVYPESEFAKENRASGIWYWEKVKELYRVQK